MSALQLAIRASKVRSRQLRHQLLVGPPGLGKTTLAHIIAAETGGELTYLTCTAVKEPKDLYQLLATAKAGAIIALDEIHALPAKCHESLYSVLEDGKLTITVEMKPGELTPLTIEIEAITVIGMTTRQGAIPEPMRDRFAAIHQLVPYSDEETRQILEWHARQAAFQGLRDPAFTAGAYDLVVPACKGTGRLAVSLVDACLDTLAVQPGQPGQVDASVARSTLKRLGYRGCLTILEYRYLDSLQTPNSQPAILGGGRTPDSPRGLKAISLALDEDESTIEFVVEPWLLQQGYIQRTSTGRVITMAGIQFFAQQKETAHAP